MCMGWIFTRFYRKATNICGLEVYMNIKGTLRGILYTQFQVKNAYSTHGKEKYSHTICWCENRFTENASHHVTPAAVWITLSQVTMFSTGPCCGRNDRLMIGASNANTWICWKYYPVKCGISVYWWTLNTTHSIGLPVSVRRAHGFCLLEMQGITVWKWKVKGVHFCVGDFWYSAVVCH